MASHPALQRIYKREKEFFVLTYAVYHHSCIYRTSKFWPACFDTIEFFSLSRSTVICPLSDTDSPIGLKEDENVFETVPISLSSFSFDCLESLYLSAIDKIELKVLTNSSTSSVM